MIQAQFKLTSHCARSVFWGAMVTVGAALLGCSSSSEEPLASQRADVVDTEAPTGVEPGSPLPPRNATCPGKKLPDVCGSWAGVELAASRLLTPHHHHQHLVSHDDSHCSCQPVSFQIPAALPVLQGKSGWDWDKVELSFRTSSGKQIECRYRGNAQPLGGHFGIPVGGDQYLFEKCSGGFKVGQTTSSDWFELKLGHGHPLAKEVEVGVRLGEPDVVDGVLQEQVFFATDPRIVGASLHVPRGAAPPFETFSLDILPAVTPGLVIPNAGDTTTSMSFGVDVHSDATEDFSFTPVAGACPRIELPYDPVALAALLGPNGEGSLQAFQLTSLESLENGDHALASAGPVTVNRAAHTMSFCVEHLSFYLGAVGSYNAGLEGAHIRSLRSDPTALARTDLSTTLPKLNAGEDYELSLAFTNTGAADWTSSTLVRLVPVTFNGANATAGATPSVWKEIAPNNVFSPDEVGAPSLDSMGQRVFELATFTFKITAPADAALMNFCPRSGTSGAPFGQCFTWDLRGAPTPGHTPVEISTTRSCYPGPAEELEHLPCQAGSSTYSSGSWSECSGATTSTSEDCDNDVDDDCDGRVNDGCFDDAEFIPGGAIPSNVSGYYENSGNCVWFGDRGMLICPTCDGVSRRLKFTMKNTGNKTWQPSKGYHFVPIQNRCTIVDGSLNLPGDIPPGSSHDFDLGISCPCGDDASFSAVLSNAPGVTSASIFGDRLVQITCAQDCQ